MTAIPAVFQPRLGGVFSVCSYSSEAWNPASDRLVSSLHWGRRWWAVFPSVCCCPSNRGCVTMQPGYLLRQESLAQQFSNTGTRAARAMATQWIKAMGEG